MDLSARNLAVLGLSTEADLGGLLDAAPDAIVVADEAGRIISVNRLAEELFGYRRSDIVGQPIETLMPDGVRQAHRRLQAAQARDAAGYAAMPSREFSGRRKDGLDFTIEVSLSLLPTADGALVSIIRDATARKAIEEKLRTSLQEKEVLLREIHHRVKNNLQVVSSMLNLQADKIVDERALALFKESRDRVRSIALFHEQLYESRDLANIDIGDYLKAVAKGQFATYGMNANEVLLFVQADQARLGVDAAICCGLIVNELLSNTCKHAFPKGRKGEVSVTLQAGAGRAVLEVADNGVGLPETTDFRESTTLGLRLVNILVQQLHGSIELDRREGARFTIRFGVPR